MWDQAAAKFKFGVGDMVTHRSDPSVPCVVLGRVLEECHGGIQRHYRCEYVTGTPEGNGLVLRDFSETAIQKYVAPEKVSAADMKLFADWIRSARRPEADPPTGVPD